MFRETLRHSARYILPAVIYVHQKSGFNKTVSNRDRTRQLSKMKNLSVCSNRYANTDMQKNFLTEKQSTLIFLFLSPRILLPSSLFYIISSFFFIQINSFIF